MVIKTMGGDEIFGGVTIEGGKQRGERLRREGGRPAQRLRDTNLGWPVQVAEVGCWVQMQSLAPVGLPRAHADLPGLCLEEEESPALRVSL